MTNAYKPFDVSLVVDRILAVLSGDPGVGIALGLNGFTGQIVNGHFGELPPPPNAAGWNRLVVMESRQMVDKMQNLGGYNYFKFVIRADVKSPKDFVGFDPSKVLFALQTTCWDVLESACLELPNTMKQCSPFQRLAFSPPIYDDGFYSLSWSYGLMIDTI